jgi:hypothetical protein
MKDTMIGVDLAKSVFQLHGASLAGHLKFRKKVTQFVSVRGTGVISSPSAV